MDKEKYSFLNPKGIETFAFIFSGNALQWLHGTTTFGRTVRKSHPCQEVAKQCEVADFPAVIIGCCSVQPLKHTFGEYERKSFNPCRVHETVFFLVLCIFLHCLIKIMGAEYRNDLRSFQENPMRGSFLVRSGVIRHPVPV